MSLSPNQNPRPSVAASCLDRRATRHEKVSIIEGDWGPQGTGSTPRSPPYHHFSRGSSAPSSPLCSVFADENPNLGNLKRFTSPRSCVEEQKWGYLGRTLAERAAHPSDGGQLCRRGSAPRGRELREKSRRKSTLGQKPRRESPWKARAESGGVSRRGR